MPPGMPFASFRRWLKNKWNNYRFGQLTGLLGGIENFVVEDRKVEGQAQPDGVGGLHLWLADVVSVLISFLGIFHNSYKLIEIAHVKITLLVSTYALVIKSIWPSKRIRKVIRENTEHLKNKELRFPLRVGSKTRDKCFWFKFKLVKIGQSKTKRKR